MWTHTGSLQKRRGSGEAGRLGTGRGCIPTVPSFWGGRDDQSHLSGTCKFCIYMYMYMYTCLFSCLFSVCTVYKHVRKYVGTCKGALTGCIIFAFDDPPPVHVLYLLTHFQFGCRAMNGYVSICYRPLKQNIIYWHDCRSLWVLVSGRRQEGILSSRLPSFLAMLLRCVFRLVPERMLLQAKMQFPSRPYL